MMDLHLTGKIAMVGGASKGLGFAVAQALAAEGAQVSMASRERDGIAAAGEAIQRETGATVLAMPADLSSADAIAAIFWSCMKRRFQWRRFGHGSG